MSINVPKNSKPYMKKNNVLSPQLAEYIDRHTSALPNYMQELERDTYLKVLMPQMLSGNVQGVFLQLFSKTLCPQYILEIGAFTGYSSICLAKGLTPKGHLYTIDINEELEELAKTYFAKAGLQDKTTFMCGDATQLIPKLDKKFDLIFIDADKRNYAEYYRLCLPKLTDRGIMLVDNVLWDGKVAHREQFNDKDTIALRNFNEMVQADTRVMNTILPIRDGIMLISKHKS